MFVKFNDENKTVVDINYIIYSKKDIHEINNSYISIYVNNTNLVLEYRDKEKLNKDYECLINLLDYVIGVDEIDYEKNKKSKNAIKYLIGSKDE